MIISNGPYFQKESTHYNFQERSMFTRDYKKNHTGKHLINRTCVEVLYLVKLVLNVLYIKKHKLLE